MTMTALNGGYLPSDHQALLQGTLTLADGTRLPDPSLHSVDDVPWGAPTPDYPGPLVPASVWFATPGVMLNVLGPGPGGGYWLTVTNNGDQTVSGDLAGFPTFVVPVGEAWVMESRTAL